MTTEPTDAEIIALTEETRTGEPGRDGYILPISFARAVLRRWGQPSGAGEPVAWYVTGCGRLLDEDEAKAEARHIGGTARAIPLYTAPQQYEALIRQLVGALEGYRRNHNDTQPCDAERAGRARLEGKP